MAGAAPSPMLHAALWYAELGYAVFPCVPGLKAPLTEHGLLEATTDTEQVTAWWTRQPDANVALRTDGLIVIDIDGEGNAWLADEPDKRVDLDAAPLSLTPRGGRHYFFRQPDGRAWRNTASRLAHHVDTRANGGYVLVAPSVAEGKPYCWQEEHELAVPPGRLPAPPAWLIEMLDGLATPNGVEAVRDALRSNAIPAGQRNDTLARLAGVMRRAGMSATEILAALNRVNVERCTPPLDAREVGRIAQSIARYSPDLVSVALIENHYDQDRSQQSAAPMSVREIMKLHLLRKPVIHGLLRSGETMNVIAPPKTGKSWLVLGQAMSIATGRPWLGLYPAERGRVLILDNELHPETIAHRIPQVAAALGVGMDEIAEQIYVHPLRGQLRDILSMSSYFDAIEPGRYAAIILDAMYRFMPAGTDENDNGAMAGIYNRLDAYAERLGCCFIAIHHTTKGNQSTKSVTDVGAGAGSQSRAADAHLVLRPHEQPGAVVLEAVVRSWPPVEPIVLRWEFPIWRAAPDLDPAALRSEKPRRSARLPNLDDGQSVEPALMWDLPTFVQICIDEAGRTFAEIAARARGLSTWKAKQFLRQAEAEGWIHRWLPKNPNCPVRFSTIPQPEAEA